MEKFIILMLFELFLISTAFCSYVDTTSAKTIATNFFVSRISQDKQAPEGRGAKEDKFKI